MIQLEETLPPEILERPGKHGGLLLYGMEVSERDWQTFFDKQVGKAGHAAEFVEAFTGPLSGRRHLDLLSGTGGFVHHFGERGAVSEGVDPAVVQAEFGERKYGLTIHRQVLSDFAVDDRFDLITAAQMLNHCFDPAAELDRIRGWLAPGGVLYLEVLNFPHAIRRKPMPQVIHVDHPLMFSKSSLEDLLRKRGFRIVAFESDDHPQREFGSKNHMHVICTPDENLQPFEPRPEAAIDARLECLGAMTQFLSNHALKDLPSGKALHWAGRSRIVRIRDWMLRNGSLAYRSIVPKPN